MSKKGSTSTQKLPRLQAYLVMHGVGAHTPQVEIDALKKQYRKEYQKQYDQKRRKEKKRLEPTLSKAEYQRLKKAAKQHNYKSMSGFLLKCALAYLDQNYIPHDAELIRSYTIQVQRIGNNVNQVVHSLHYQKDYANKAAYQEIKKQIDFLQKKIGEHLTSTLPIGQELIRLFEEQPETVAYFEEFLAEWKAKND